MKKNDWQQRYGAKRRAIDKAILAECERQIEPPAPVSQVQSSQPEFNEWRDSIVKKFGIKR